jgi:hypothetical protein
MIASLEFVVSVRLDRAESTGEGTWRRLEIAPPELYRWTARTGSAGASWVSFIAPRGLGKQKNKKIREIESKLMDTHSCIHWLH